VCRARAHGLLFCGSVAGPGSSSGLNFPPHCLTLLPDAPPATVNHSVHNEVEVEAGLADREVFEFECCVDNVTSHLAAGIAEWQRAFHEPPSRLAFPGGFATPEAVRIARGTFHLQLRTIIDGLFHRIYHCDDSFCPAPFLCTTDSLNRF